MQHNFDVDLAVQYGILEAVLLNNIWYWVEKNEANEMNFFEGRYWTYNSTKAFSKLFPYASQKQIQRALSHLKEEDILMTGNFNKSAYDRTLWYAFTDKGMSIMRKGKMDMDKRDDSILPNWEMDNPKKENGLTENVQPIPNIKPNINSDINFNSSSSSYVSSSHKDSVEEGNFKDEDDKKDILKVLEENFCRPLSSFEIEYILEQEKAYSYEILCLAIKQCVIYNVRNIRYLQSILQNWYGKSLDEINTMIEQNRKKDEERPDIRKMDVNKLEQLIQEGKIDGVTGEWLV